MVKQKKPSAHPIPRPQKLGLGPKASPACGTALHARRLRASSMRRQPQRSHWFFCPSCDGRRRAAARIRLRKKPLLSARPLRRCRWTRRKSAVSLAGG
ncbi:hypothetical protein BS78_05G143600 [Paspalum vaginatum]|nr:hypothetical protein BS78_05G143600 [Paspalum vaginatum]